MISPNNHDLPLAQSLTPREKEVLNCLGDGLSNRQIAEHLVISLSTVKWYVRQIHNKLGVDNRKAAVVRAQSLGLLPAGERQDLPRHNLPVAATPFVGREGELATLAGLIADPQVRIITITGPGGIGKTRLALETARRQLEQLRHFPDGIFFISLAPLESTQEIVTTLAATLDFHFQSSGNEKEQILRYLRQKNMLLVMDNFEHILNGRSLLVETNERAAEVTLLVTSRERLQLHGEQLFALGGLETAQTGDSLAESPSSELFMNIARRTDPTFQLQEGDAEHLLRICQLVDGMPLGLELAASWAGLLPLSEIAAEIGQSLDLLAAEQHDVPLRHKSMEAALDVSWRRLTAEQKRAFQELTVFRGGFTRTAALEVAGATLPLLATLANKSWLSYDRQEDRYHIHELLRQYGAGRLSADPAHEQAVQTRHSAFFCAYLQERDAQWFGPRQTETASEVHGEIDKIRPAKASGTARPLEAQSAVTAEAENARVALRWALKQGAWNLLAQSIDSWLYFLQWQGRMVDGEPFCQEIIGRAEQEDAGESEVSPDCLRAWVKARAWLEYFAPNYGDISGRAERSLALLNRPQLAGLDTRRDKAFVRLRQAHLLVVTDPEEARSLYEQLLVAYQALDDQWGINECLLGLGRIDFDTGHFAPALERMEAVERIYRERGDLERQGNTLSMLGFIHQDLGRLDEAERLHRDALSLSLKIGYGEALSWQQANLARTLLWQGKLGDASRLAEASLINAEQGGGQYEEFTARLTLGSVQVYAGHYEPARQEVARILPVIEKEGSLLSHKAWLSHLQGLLALVSSSFIEAQSAFAASLDIWHSTYPHHFVSSLTALGLTAFRLGQLPQARGHLVEALANAQKYRSIAPALATFPPIALVLAADGDKARAVEIWLSAKSFPFIANSKWFEDVAGRELEALVDSSPPDVTSGDKARGRELDVWEMAGGLLLDLDKPIEP